MRETLNSLRATIQAIDQANVAVEQSSQLKSLNETQEKVEWIELFIISFYGAELSKTVSEMFRFEHEYAQWSVVATALVAVVVAFFLLGLGRSPEPMVTAVRKSRLSPKGKLLLLAGAFAAWFLIGYVGFRPDSVRNGVEQSRQRDETIARVLNGKPGAQEGMRAKGLRERLQDEWARALRARANGEKMGEKEGYERAEGMAVQLEQMERERTAAEAGRAAFVESCMGKCLTLPEVRQAVEEARRSDAAEQSGVARDAWIKAKRLADAAAKR